MDSSFLTSSPQPTILRHIKDPIHDQIPVTAKLASFIDTQQFQRLRNIKQLGATFWVWPSATHTRFEHSLGVAYLARLTASHLQRSQPELEISDRDVDCVEIAGLCHDLGHGPWSHVWDGVFIPRALPGSKWKHEHASEMMFDALVRDNDVKIPEIDQKFIKALISGEASRTPHEKPFLFDIVANQRNGLDVDKIDYIHRDSHMVGEAIRHSLLRLINSARVVEKQICYNIKDANQIYDLCASRFRLHKIFYNHKSAKAIEHMIVDALLAAEPVLKFAHHIDDPERFLYLTDHIMSEVLSSNKPELAESRRIFNRIVKRDLYRCVDYKVINWPYQRVFRDNITSKKIFDSVLALRTTPFPLWSSELQESDIIVNFTEMHYGKKEKNPLDFMLFYTKHEPNVCQAAGQGCYSNLKPPYFSEFLLRVYTKKAEFAEIVQQGYREILNRLQKQEDSRMGEPLPDVVGVHQDSGGRTAQEGSGSIVPTPPATEAPTTPKMSGPGLHSRDSSFTFRASGESPFANNKFTDFPKNRSVSPTRAGPDLELTPVVMNPTSPSPAPGKRRRPVEARQDEESSQKAKKRRSGILPRSQ